MQARMRSAYDLAIGDWDCAMTRGQGRPAGRPFCRNEDFRQLFGPTNRNYTRMGSGGKLALESRLIRPAAPLLHEDLFRQKTEKQADRRPEDDLET